MKITNQKLAKVHGITIEKVACNPKNYTNYSSRDVDYVVVHYTGNVADTAKNNANYFKNNGNAAVSAHYFVDDTHIVQSVDLVDMAWCCGDSKGYKTACKNANSINIEMCTSGSYKVSEKTQINTAYLVADLMKMLGHTDVDKYVLRHYDVGKGNKACPKQYVTYPEQFKQFKTWVKNILKYGSHIVPTKKPYSGTFPQPTLKLNSSGTQVTYLQKFLVWAVGYDGKVNGVFGPITEQYVIKYQKMRGLWQDGIVGKKTVDDMKLYKK